jgi:hypothetical protein
MTLTFDLSKLKQEASDEERAVLTPSFIKSGIFPETRWDSTDALESSKGHEPTLAVYLVLHYNAALRNTYCGSILDVVTRVLYAVAVLFAIAVCIVWGLNRSFLAWSELDWFAWVLWGLVAISEVFLVVSRLCARWTFTGEHAHKVVRRGSSCWALVDMIMKREAFGAWWQALIVIVVQLVGSVLLLAGILVIESRMLVDGNRSISAGFTAPFIFVIFSLVLAAFVDCVRVKEIDSVGGWNAALETLAWRTVLMTVIVPPVSVAFVLYANLCCKGGFFV